MSQKLLYLISFVLVLGMAGNALAQVDVDWTNDGGDRRWDNPLNWLTGTVPTAADKAGIRNSGVGPIIDSSTTAVANTMPVGDWSNSGVVDITGGSLTTNGWFILGYGGADEGTFNVSGGTTTVVGSGTDMTVGRSGVGHLNISAGSIEVGDRLYVGRNASGTGYITMTGGLITIIDDLYAEAGTTYINVSGGVIDIGERIFLGNGTGGEGHLTMTGGSITLGQLMAIGRDGASGEVHLDGGTLDIGYWLEMSGNASIDITGGTLIIDGDRISDGVERSIMPYINDGRIAAYGGIGTLNVDYNTTNPGKTTLTAVLTQASEPEPEHEETGVCRTVVLSWTPGEYAPPVNGHKVYFSENFNDVSDGIGGIAQDANSYEPPGRLDFGTTYHWRVDEVNGPPDYTVYEGDVWSFTTEPLAYAVENITATASSTDTAKGPENTVNNSGLDDSGLLHGNEGVNTMWLSSRDGTQPTWIEYEFDNVHKLHEMRVWNSNESLEPMIGLGFKDVSIDYSLNGTDYTTLGTTHEFAQAPGTPGYAHNTTVDFSGVAAKYVRLTANSNWGGILTQYGLSEVRFFYIPILAKEPYPASGAIDVPLDLGLTWRAGREAAKHDVYFSDDLQAVVDGTAPVATVTETSHGPVALDLGKTYYWRVDEVNDAETPTTWQGDVWNFRTHEYFVVDDFEDYNDYPPDEIFSTWIDGYGTTTNGSTAGYAEPDFLAGEHYIETTIVHSGDQSMPLFYDNNFKYSEATMTLVSGRDWTRRGAGGLSLWFYGDTSNAAERMYVTLNGSAVLYHGNPDAAQIGAWTEWPIDLQEFAAQGVNLTNVNTITIGFGDKNNLQAGSSGMVFFDDIRLYRPAPEPAP